MSGVNFSSRFEAIAKHRESGCQGRLHLIEMVIIPASGDQAEIEFRDYKCTVCLNTFRVYGCPIMRREVQRG